MRYAYQIVKTSTLDVVFDSEQQYLPSYTQHDTAEKEGVYYMEANNLSIHKHFVRVISIAEDVVEEDMLEGHMYPGHECWDDDYDYMHNTNNMDDLFHESLVGMPNN